MILGAWDVYNERVLQTGALRDAMVEQAKITTAQMIYDSPSCHRVAIDGNTQYVSITHSANIDVKRICSIPGEHLTHGGLVDFADNKWLISELDADGEIYDRGTMLRCNHILRWKSRDGTIKEKWCVIEDGTKLKRIGICVIVWCIGNGMQKAIP